MKFERIRPYRVHALDADDRRTPLDAHGVVIELGGGLEVWIDFAPHPAHAGELAMMTPSPANGAAFLRAGKHDDFEVTFGASNVLHVRVKRRLRKKARVEKTATPRPRRDAVAGTKAPKR